jgi:hypothetical protein
MLASKIKIGHDYAIKSNHGLVRFRVDSVVTERSHTSSTARVKGFIVEDHVENDNRDQITLSPTEIRGPYEDFADLIERKKREDADRVRKEIEDVEAAEQLRHLLYSKSGLAIPNDPSIWRKEPFDTDYGKLILDPTGVRALLAILKKD